jgi:dUTP pyrophosphatase
MNTHNVDDLIRQIKLFRMQNTQQTYCDNFAILKLVVHNNQLRDKYTFMVDAHNKNMLELFYPDSGFDLLFPDDVVFDKEVSTKFVDLNVKTEMLYVNVAQETFSGCAFSVHPRSSISKTPLMLANHTGIIDAGYRGNLIGAFRWLNDDNSAYSYNVMQYTRLLQACHPTLCPVYVILLEDNTLSSSERGAGGFGSTGA